MELGSWRTSTKQDLHKHIFFWSWVPSSFHKQSNFFNFKWVYFKNIFGQKEKYFLMSILFVQSVLWMFLHSNRNYKDLFISHIEYVQYFEFLLVAVVLVYFVFQKADKKQEKAGKNLKKFQLFRFVYLLVAFIFYLVPYGNFYTVSFF